MTKILFILAATAAIFLTAMLTNPCTGAKFTGRPNLVAECQHQRTVSPAPDGFACRLACKTETFSNGGTMTTCKIVDPVYTAECPLPYPDPYPAPQ